MASIFKSTSSQLSNYRPLTLVAPYVLSMAILGLTTVTYRDYCAWYALGRGGVPYNFFGYVVQGTLQWIYGAKDQASTECFDEVIEKERKEIGGQRIKHTRRASQGYESRKTEVPIESRSWIPGGSIPKRRGQRPQMGKWAVPQRMIDLRGSSKMYEALVSFINNLADDNRALLTRGPSQIECGSPGLFLSPALGTPFIHDHKYPTNPPSRHITHPAGPSEFFHVHDAEGSMHALLSATDAKEVAAKGWGIRHALAGQRGTPWGYMLIYAPRDSAGYEDELETVKKIVVGAATYALEGKGAPLKQEFGNPSHREDPES